MSPETVLLSVSLVLAFGGVPLATLIDAHIATTRAARHVAEIEQLAASRADLREQHVDGLSNLDVHELQALAMAVADELNERSEAGARGKFRGDLRSRRRPSQPLVKAG
jgi:hypothetical protein